MVGIRLEKVNGLDHLAFSLPDGLFLNTASVMGSYLGGWAALWTEDNLAEFPDHPFWNFSLDVYMSEGVGPAFLELQNAHELDVNILLFCMWVGASGRGVLSKEQMATLTDAVYDWHNDVVRALRAVRVRMKGGLGTAPEALGESLRQRIQKTEIDCEHAEQLMLADAVDSAVDEGKMARDRIFDAVHNLSAYFSAFGSVSDTDRGHLAFILNVVFPELDASYAEEAVAAI